MSVDYQKVCEKFLFFRIKLFCLAFFFINSQVSNKIKKIIFTNEASSDEENTDSVNTSMPIIKRFEINKIIQSI